VKLETKKQAIYYAADSSNMARGGAANGAATAPPSFCLLENLLLVGKFVPKF